MRNSDVIDTAAGARMTALRQHQNGVQAAQCARILNHLAQARLCLLDQRSKAAYDQWLREQSSAGTHDVDEVDDFENPIKLEVKDPVKPVKAATDRSSSLNYVLIATVLGVVSVCGVVWQSGLLSGKNGTTATKSAKADTRRRATRDQNEGAADKPADPVGIQGLSKDDLNEHANRDFQNSTGPENLLQLVNISKDSANGKWELSNGTLLSPLEPNSLLYSRSKWPAEYDLRLNVTRRLGGDAFVIGFPIDGVRCALTIDAAQGTLSGLETIDGQRLDRNPTQIKGRQFSAGKVAEILLQVRHGHILAQVDKKTLIDWKGAASQLATPAGFRAHEAEFPFVLTFETQYEISHWELIPQLSAPTPVAPPAVSAIEMKTAQPVLDPSGSVTSPSKPVVELPKLSAKQLRVFKRHDDFVTRVGFHRLQLNKTTTITKMFSTGRDGRVLVWDLDQVLPPVELIDYNTACWALAVNRGQAPLIAFSEIHWQWSSYIKVWSCADNNVEVKQLNPSRGEGIGVHAVDFSPDGVLLAAGTRESTLRLWRTFDYAEATSLQAIDNITSVAFGPGKKDKKLAEYPLAVGCNNGKVEFYQVRFQEIRGQIQFSFKSAEIQPQKQLDFRITRVTYSPDGKLLISCGERGQIAVWDAATGALLRQWAADPIHTVEWIDFNPVSKQAWVLSAHGDGTAKIWDANTGTLLLSVDAHEKALFCAQFTPDGRFFATASADSTLKLWELNGPDVPIDPKAKKKPGKKP